ncbi:MULTISPECIES: MarR family winged helix-turn-helix transcriptional regulator [Sinorhizobium]|uniref:MarR family winged helix-turn-helix transcriptional regulator n=1 Tax=Sinorhizobium TaxID=28105 RepID=UPI000FD8CD14|nr:MarR family winged helix-turn-helix transcriptional regulator [Sinorhizobium medicae]MDW9532238.1 hypothetical protein [Sinorhizobium meliloti]RVP49996.1 MarR family transcriptional regulator [Sinorhizobium medicae]RVP74885.1 MarR family transcriptional regulator [Sinorhizobium medicae]UWU09380.1 MarR family winged helix-turn-helix transcriptional regulator [Sinorhizobium medicae]
MSATTLTADNKTARKFINFIEEFRKLNPKMQAGQISLFLHIVGTPELTIRELAQRTGLGDGGSITRKIDELTKSYWKPVGGEMKEVPGLDLVETYEDPRDRRFKRVRATRKGNQVFNTLIELLGS